MANAMLRVPSVTMKGGSRTYVIRAPFRSPNALQARSRRRSRVTASMPEIDGELGHDDGPNAITIPQERSMPR